MTSFRLHLLTLCLPGGQGNHAAVLTPTALAEALQSLGIPSGYALARLIGVAPRTAQKWLTGQTPVPGPVAILVRLMLDNPAVFRAVVSRSCNSMA